MMNAQIDLFTYAESAGAAAPGVWREDGSDAFTQILMPMSTWR